MDFHTPQHEKFMALALEQAQLAAKLGEVPVGAVIAQGKHLVSRAHNLKEKNRCGTQHAEVLALQKASQALKRWRLTDCQIYVTLEPCLMCCGAILQARLSHVFFGAPDPKFGAVTSLFSTLNDPRLNHQCEFTGGLLKPHLKNY